MIQLQVINYILNSQDSLFILKNNLDDSFFPELIAEFNFIKNHVNQYGNVPDKVTFKNKFSEFKLIEVLEPPEYLIKELYSDKNNRLMTEQLHKIVDAMNAGDQAEAQRLYVTGTELLKENASLRSVDLYNDTTRFNEYLQKLDSPNNFYVTTGFDELDELIGGWDRQEELATIVARTGVGKSWILLKSAQASVDAGLRVGVYSGEMSESKVGYRIDTVTSHISNTSLMRGREDVQLEYQQYIQSLTEYGKNHHLFVLTPAMAGGSVSVNTLRAFIEREHLDILFVDQRSLLEDDRKARNPFDRASNISMDLKNLQVLKKIPIITVSQQNRTSTENGAGSEHVAMSDRISQDSTVLLFIEQEKIDGIPTSRMTLNLVKSRDSGSNKKLSYTVDINHGTFDFDPEATDNENDTESNNSTEPTYSYGSEPF